MTQGARVFAAQRYRLSTLKVASHLLVAVVAGRKTLHACGRTVRALQGHGVMIARGTQWDVVNDPCGRRQYEAWALAFDDAMVCALPKSVTQPTRVASPAQVLALDDQVLEAIRRTLPGERQTSKTLLAHRSTEVLLMLAERGWSFPPSRDLSWAERIQRMVSQRPDADWSASAIASGFHMSESSVRRRLQDGPQTLAALVRDARLQAALGMLQSTDLSVGEVAQSCGWASHSRFSAAFQARWGVAPSVVRSRMKETAQNLTGSG